MSVGGAGSGGAGRIRIEYCTTISGGTANPPASIQQITCKTPTAGLNITKLGQYSPPKSCYNVFTSGQSLLFQVCDNDWLGAPATNAACTHAGNLCTDEDPTQGKIKVTVTAGDYHIVESVAPPNHTISTGGKQDCNASSGNCTVTVIDAPIVRPWYPWDLTGPCHVPDGLVRIEDVVSVIQHYRQDKPLPGTPQPSPTPTAVGTATPTPTPQPGC